MKSFLLLGPWRNNNGPANVNASLIRNADSSMLYLKSKNKLAKIFEIFFKIIYSKTIVMSGFYSYPILFFLKVLRKRLVFLVHGDFEYENEINNLNRSDICINRYRRHLEYSSVIIGVSAKFSQSLKIRYPMYSDKIMYINNGVSLSRRAAVDKDKYTIAVCGGNRSIKNNLYVCLAVEKLINEGLPCKVYIFGWKYENNDDILDLPFVCYKGHIPHDDFYKCLDKINLLVVNSDIESFGLSVIDGLNCNCSILLSENVGAGSLFIQRNSDVIFNTKDIEEISEKIKFLLSNPNCDRLLGSMDIDSCSEANAFSKLKDICIG